MACWLQLAIEGSGKENKGIACGKIEERWAAKTWLTC
jgi:hypothetical protein